MKKTLLFLFLVLFFYETMQANNEKELQILFAAAMPDISKDSSSDYARLATLLKNLKKENQNTLFLFGGNSLSPSYMSSLDKGSHIIDILNSLEPDAMSVDKRDFAYYEDELSLRSFEAAFPMVASNIYDQLTLTTLDGLYSNLIIEKDGIKIGIISVINYDVIEEYVLKRIKVTNIQKAIKKHSKILREKKADVIILLTSNNFKIIDDLLKNKIIDFSFTKDSHYYHKDKIIKNKRNIFFHDTNKVSIVNFTYNSKTKKIFNFTNTLQELKHIKKDLRVKNQVQSYISRVKKLYEENIGVFKNTLTTKRDDLRNKENAFANLITDIMREYTNSQIAILNSGTIRGDRVYKKDYVISRKDIAKELPFGNKIVLLKVSGKQLYEILEHSFSSFEEKEGRFLQVSGLEVIYNLKRTNKKRIKTLYINKKKIKLNSFYTLSTSDYLSSGGDGYKILKNVKKINFSNPKNRYISDILIEYIIKNKYIYTSLENRIKVN